MDIKEIESAISQLSPAELAELAAWFEEFLAQAWDSQIEEDMRKGRLDELMSQAEQKLSRFSRPDSRRHQGLPGFRC